MRPTSAFDLDEVVFPFAAAYATWRRQKGLVSFDPATLVRYDFAAALGDEGGGPDATSDFLDAPETLGVREGVAGHPRAACAGQGIPAARTRGRFRPLVAGRAVVDCGGEWRAGRAHGCLPAQIRTGQCDTGPYHTG